MVISFFEVDSSPTISTNYLFQNTIGWNKVNFNKEHILHYVRFKK